MRITHYQFLEIQNTASQEDIKKAYRRLALVWHPDTAKEWASVEQLSDCENIFKRISTAYEVLSNDGKRQQYDSNLVLNLPLTLEEKKQENAFKIQLETLKKHHAIYKARQQDPQAYINYLHTQIIQAKNQSEKLISQLQKIDKETKGFHDVFERYKQNTDSKINELNEKNHSLEMRMTLQQKENHELTNQNAMLLEQIQKLQKQNHELQLRQSSDNASYFVQPNNNSAGSNLDKGSENSFPIKCLGIFAANQNTSAFIGKANNNLKIRPDGLKLIYC